MSALPKLFKRNTTGSIQTWEIKVKGGSYSTLSGKLDGKIKQSHPTTCKGKNTGKDNETTDAEQAQSEAKSKWTKQHDKGYTADIDNVDAALAAFFRPMLAEKFIEEKYNDDGTIEIKKANINYPAFAQRKFDGMRCTLSAKGAYSRKGKPIATVPHLLALFKPVFEKYPTAVFDGELYNHALKEDFEKMMSLCKKSKPTVADLFEAEEMVQFHIYDFPIIKQLGIKDPFFTRNQVGSDVLTEFGLLGTEKVCLVETLILENEEQIPTYHDQFVDDEGFEGVIVRLNGPYENKRSWNLLKVKIFTDEEFEIVDFEPGRGRKAHIAAKVVCYLHDKSDTFKAGIIGSEVRCEEYLRNKHNYIGKEATVKFFGYTKKANKPRHGKLKIIRDYE